ncbi:4'-phosphopantetheinyl transferase family protein [Pediococcus acidilactici]|uniref:4'-phosphopantetheinyl transferase family protein n=1 Tax=Pediococcus acidilactici TaxID=1254 RepID=UPI003B42BE2E
MKVYQVDFSGFTLREWQILFEGVNKNTCIQLKLSRIKDDNTKKTQVVSCLVKRYLLFLNGAKKFYYGTYGKPLVDSKAFKFNITHTEQLVFGVVDKNEVGIDAEAGNTLFIDFCHLFCTRKEMELLDRYSDREKNRLLWRLWTFKESYVKLLGIGLNLDLKNIKILDSLDMKHFINNRIQHIKIEGVPIIFYSKKIEDCYITICQYDDFREQKDFFLRQIGFEELFKAGICN